IEGYNDSYIARTYDTTDGELYSVKTSEQLANAEMPQGNRGEGDGGDTPSDMGNDQQPPTGATPTGETPTGEVATGEPPTGENQNEMQQEGSQEGFAPPNMEGEAAPGQMGRGNFDFDMPSAMQIIRDNGEEINEEVKAKLKEIGLTDENITQLEEMTKNGMGFGGGPGSNGKGNTLVYTDDEYESYSSIFDNAITSPNEKDYDQVIEALKNLNQGTNLEEYFDVDQILRYLAAHTVVVNADSYYGSMCQNYVIYEEGGKLTILPWDYGLAFGGMGDMGGMGRGMGSEDASAQLDSTTSFINTPIDTPIQSSISMEDRPMFAMLMQNEEYKARYHQYINEIMTGYFGEELFEDKIDTLQSIIDPYVESDVSAFVEYDAYKEAVTTFKALVRLRVDSIKGQLAGEIPSTTEGQNLAPEKLITTTEYDISKLGNNMGGGKGGFGGGPEGNDANRGQPQNMPPGEFDGENQEQAN
ncbi:MAG: CotH kinase family protein, partial [Anaerotignum sp.]